jgi:hypothetical protein
MKESGAAHEHLLPVVALFDCLLGVAAILGARAFRFHASYSCCLSSAARAFEETGSCQEKYRKKKFVVEDEFQT